MRLSSGLSLAVLALAVTACADAPLPTAADLAPEGLSQRELLGLSTPDVELRRPKVDVTKWLDQTTSDPNVFLPAGPVGIGTGSPILITIPNDGRYGCTANFIWQDGDRLFLGAAGHCFVPATAKATHGPAADYDASGVTVQVCVSGCEGNFRTMTLVGQVVTLGKVAYARQTDPTATEDVGNDFGVVEIPAQHAHLVRLTMPVWGGPSGKVENMEFGKFACHYGNGTGTGETVLTKARVGVGGGTDAVGGYWYGDFAGAPGDSGSGIEGCESDGASFAGQGAIGVLTHLGVGTGEVKYKGVKTKVEHGFVLGTTVARSIEMAKEAGLNLTLVQQ